ncbi:uncharacterized protein EI90DRAFT_2965501 [Cantharellus anzutake]|uniref:uncharacterized protein n=1 Tax=Cantharellus anzutake TaxID=1750568 RepID=UPI001902C83D|nr:uncharacterized protein EI90DRAFT_2965501 [Cantharellus anzutake]KAF8341234.1 hypothetical protein EI90DRAFT_2965501 [Cantharellus anzutake]
MSLRQGLRQKIDEILAAGGDMAIPILTAVNAAADMFPPLKSATNGALFIISEVQKFKENKKEWEDFGRYVVDNVAEVVAAIKSYDPSTEEAKPWVESAEKLDRALQRIKSEIEQRRTKIKKRSALINALSHLRDPGRIDSLKKDLDKALASFQLRTNLTVGVKLSVIEDDLILGRLRYPDVAHHDSTQTCLEGTRLGLTEQIMAWCHDTRDSGNRVMLLTAVAGAGKTSIAHTIAERCARERSLLLSFFFKAGEQSRPDCLFSGMARALAKRDQAYRSSIISALQDDPTLSTAPFAMQFRRLVAPPLLHKPPLSDRPMVVIIDALDECDEEAFESLANILREEVPKLPSCIKFFITSRQFDLVNRFLSSHFPIDRLSIDLLDDANVQDCATYIRSQLQTLKNCHPDTQHKLEDEKTVEGILERAGGLFIWISTIFRYMRKASKDPMRTLEGLLGTGAKGSTVSAEGMMDRLYSSILKKCGWEDEDFGHDYPVVMGAIFVAQQPLSVAAWDAILSPFLKSSVRYTLAELAPLLSGLEDPDNPIRILHQSFRDFILERIDPRLISLRCSPVDVGRENARIALRCTEILNEDLSSLEGLGLIEDLYEKDELPRIPPEKLSKHLHYACRYIVYHLSGVQEQSQGLDKSVRTFLSQQATRWMEVCVRMEGYISISILPEWAELVVDQRSKDAICMLANVLFQLGLNLEFFSRFREAYEAAKDSVVLCRCLVSVDSESYTPELAWSLSALYSALSNLGRHSEALPFIEETVKLQRELVAVHPGSYTPDLAASLNSLCNALSDLGQHSGALPFIEESVKLRRELVAIHPGLYNADLAQSLHTLCATLLHLGRHSEALPFVEESVKLRRELVAVHPGSYDAGLALSLNNLFVSLSRLGQHSEAHPFIEESVKLRRKSVALHPGSYNPDLASSLNNLVVSLSNLGRHSEALPLIEECIELRRELVAIHPGSYTPDLAWSLSNLYAALSNLGRHSEALPFIEESVKLQRELVAIHPESYNAGLAWSLKNLYSALSDLGQHSEALPFIEECVKLYRELAAINPGLHTSNLDRSLNTLRTARSDLGCDSEPLI